MRRFVLKTLLLTVSVSLAVLMAEFLVRAVVLGGPVAAAKSVLATVPLSSAGADPTIVPDRELGFRYNPLQPNVNSLGIRGPELSLLKNPGQLRLIVLGDSVSIFTDGSEAPELNFAGILSQRLGSNAEVINAAIAGYTTHQQRLLFERELAPYRPDAVILQYSLNDHARYSSRWAGDQLIMTEEARQAFLSEDDALAWMPGGSYLGLRIRVAYRLWGEPKPKYPWEGRPGWNLPWRQDSWPAFEAEIRKIKQSAGQGGGRLLLMMVPFGLQFDKRLLAAEREAVLVPQREMAKVCRSVGVPLLDLFPAIEEAGGSSNFYDTVHLTAAGQQLVAEELTRKLLNLEWIPASIAEPIPPTF